MDNDAIFQQLLKMEAMLSAMNVKIENSQREMVDMEIRIAKLEKWYTFGEVAFKIVTATAALAAALKLFIH